MLLRKLGQFVAKLRGMASEFRASFDEMARQSELDRVRDAAGLSSDSELVKFLRQHSSPEEAS